MASEALGGIGLQLSQLREHVVEVDEECALHVFDAPPDSGCWVARCVAPAATLGWRPLRLSHGTDANGSGAMRPGPRLLRAVKGGRRPAQRTLDGARQTHTLKARRAGDDLRCQPPSRSGGKDCPALGAG